MEKKHSRKEDRKQPEGKVDISEHSEKDKEFFAKQAALKAKWQAIWGGEKKSRQPAQPPVSKTPSPAKPQPPRRALCCGGGGFGCSNNANVQISSNLKTHFSFGLCEKCFQFNSFNLPEGELPEGVTIVIKSLDGKIETRNGKMKEPEEKEKPRKPVPSVALVSPTEEKDNKFDAKTKPNSAFLFNGQGAQAIGMTLGVQDLPAVKELYAKANDILGYDLRHLVLKGSNDDLRSTIYSQPAMLVAGLCAVEKLKAENPQAVRECTAAAGLSLGEYTALVFAEALSLEDALRLVKARAEAMEDVAKKTRGGMISIVGLDDQKLQEMCEKVQGGAKKGEVITIANLLFPEGRVVSGNEELLVKIEKLANDAGATKVTRVHVSGAFHTKLMEPASNALKAALQKVTLKVPRIPVYSNVTGKPFESVEEIREGLATQLCSPVLWEQSLKQIISDGHCSIWELSPRAKPLKAMVTRIDKKIGRAVKLVDV